MNPRQLPPPPCIGHSATLRLLVLTIFTALSATPSPSVEQERFAAVVAYWEWSSYWRPDGLDFERATYKAGRTFRALVFYSDSTSAEVDWGFCSTQLGICQAYTGDEDGTIVYSSSTKIRKSESASAALARFRRQEFAGDGFPEVIADFGRQQTAQPASPGAPQPALQMGGGKPPADHDDLLTLIRVIQLPPLRPPEAVRLNTSNTIVEEELRKGGPGPPFPSPTCALPRSPSCTNVVPATQSSS